MKKIIIISCCMLLFIITGCDNTKKQSKSELLKRVLEMNNYIVLDVRTEEEYEAGHVKDAINLPYDEIDENIILDKDKTILVYCKSGKRSGIAYETLTKLGYQVIDLGAYDKVTLEKE